MREILVIRFGALGDLCVLGWALTHLADSQPPGTCRVTLVTKAAFAPLMSQIRGIDEVIALEGSGPAAVRRLAGQLRKRRWDVVLDAHNTLRSHLVLGLLGRRPNARLAKDTIARLGFMAWGRPHPRLDQRMRDRFDALCDVITPAVGLDPAPTRHPPLAHLRGGVTVKAAPTATPVLGLAPGAQWDTKRWPAENFTTLLDRFRAAYGGTVRVYLGPREQAWYPGSTLKRTVAADDTIELVRLPDLRDVARSLATTDVVVTNDSGLLHLAEAVGTPVLAFFGPTVREFGYFPLLADSRSLETGLDCRPCSRNGKRSCHRSDLACLTGITPELALENLIAMLPKDTPS